MSGEQVLDSSVQAGGLGMFSKPGMSPPWVRQHGYVNEALRWTAVLELLA
jgi:hypothetical protein